MAEIVEGEVRLSIGKDEFERLDEYEEPPPTKQIQADYEPIAAPSSRATARASRGRS